MMAIEGEPTRYRPHWEIVRTPKGWRARFRAGNSLTIFSSQVYSHQSDALRAIEMVAPGVTVTAIDARVEPRKKPRRTPIERFEEKIAPSPSGCWIWTAYVTRGGYGHFHIDGKDVLAHRWSYEYHVGPIPEGLTIDHLCRVTRCVNPQHLEPVTPRVNSRRGSATQRTHCPQGHEYSPENTHVWGGKRRCRACARIRAAVGRKAARLTKQGAA